jgi:hypothetical protein
MGRTLHQPYQSDGWPPIFQKGTRIFGTALVVGLVGIAITYGSEPVVRVGSTAQLLIDTLALVSLIGFLFFGSPLLIKELLRRSEDAPAAAAASRLSRLFDRLGSEGATARRDSYPGRMVRLPDGSSLGLRKGPSGTGGILTMEVRLADGTFWKGNDLEPLRRRAPQAWLGRLDTGR